MFINLSNHPSAGWDTKQLDAASPYGEIVDIPFPAIPPDWDAEKVQALAYSYYWKCVKKIGTEVGGSAIHLAGELVFCSILSQMLIHEGYVCLSSTTLRKSDMKGATKVSTFEFIRFRNYKILLNE